MSMEFGPGGRVHQLWIGDPTGGSDDTEHQFILPPLSLDDDFVDDYLPGAILIGARTRPDDPWIVSRNSDARIASEGEDMLQISFEYEFSLLPEIRAVGHFFERPGAVPHIVWDVTIENRGKVSLEIGELGFPFGFNNMYRGYPETEAGSKALMAERLTIHPSLAGSASYLHVQRLNGEAPALVVAPGDDTVWEMISSVPSTIKGPEPWPGIPVAYIYSRATIDREGWPESFDGNSALVMEPGEKRRFRTVFLPCDSGDAEGAMAALAAANQPTIGLWPGAVAPAEVGILVQVAGATPTQVYSDRDADLDADSEEGRGSCQVSPKEPGPLRFSFEDTEGRTSWAQLLFTEPIETLIKRRAKWIVDHQVLKGAPFDGAILLSNLSTGEPYTELDDFNTPFGMESSLADALFLAEKNRRWPVDAELKALEHYVKFIAKKVQNPATFEVGFSFENGHSPAIVSSSRSTALLLARFYLAYSGCGDEEHGQHFLHMAASTVRALGSTRILTIAPKNADKLTYRRIANSIASGERFARENQYAWRPDGFRYGSVDFEVYTTAKELNFVNVHRSLAPCWWWYGSDTVVVDDPRERNRAAADKGHLCLGPTTPAFAEVALRYLQRDRSTLPVGALRMAFGGLLGVWALVRSDGAAAHGFCPDPASEQFGMSEVTGTVGLALYHYLRLACAYVDPSTDLAFGCFVSQEKEWTKVTPWDGVGRRIVVRAYGLVVESEFGFIRELRFKRDRSEAVIRIENTSSHSREVKARIKGLWGVHARVNGEEAQAIDGWIDIQVSCEAEAAAIAEVRIQK